MSDTILRGISENGHIRMFAAETTELVRTAQKIHKTYPIATAALGRLLTAAAMMGSMLKGENDTLTLQVRGDGPLGGVLAVGNSKAQVKGYVNNPHVILPSRVPGKLNVGEAVGKGTLSVIMDLGLKEPYVAQTELVSGEIAEDLTAYYAISEQVPSAVALGVLVDTDGSVMHAGGFILQLMPGSSDEDALHLEQTIAKLPSVTSMLKSNMDCKDIILAVTKGFTMKISDEVVRPEYRCDCTRERVEKALISLGKEELKSLIAEQDDADLTCHFCDAEYHFTKTQLKALLDEAKA